MSELERIIEPLLKWYQENRRELPWREDRDPYHVWVSEIMLQQTRIEAVKRYYARFMKELPKIKDLAEISEERLLKLWEGLGYYSRARNLKKAAQKVMEEYRGVMPKSYEELLKLPGIGEYTAGAIASICYDEKVTAVDGNVLRVISRVIGSKKDVLLPETKKEIEAMVKEILPEQAGQFNESLMELGELVCLPNGAPECEKCPLKKMCIAYKKELTGEIPVRIKKVKRRKEEKTVLLVISANQKIALRKREEKGVLFGLYELPNLPKFLNQEEIEKFCKEKGLEVEEIQELDDTKHIFTHIDWIMQNYLVRIKEENKEWIWSSIDELNEKYALPTAFQKIFVKAASKI